MEFFDKKQEVIDVRLTQFGKNLLARGYFKPVYYRFFDDDILYNSEFADFLELQNNIQDRIISTPRIKTQHVRVSVEDLFDEDENEIKSGSMKTFTEITRNQKPRVTSTLLKYPLQNYEANNPEAPRFIASVRGPQIKSSSNSLVVDGIDLPIAQLEITSSYVVSRDGRDMVAEVPETVLNSDSYIDLSSEQITFLDNSKIILTKEDVILDIEEFNVDLGLDNFELEIYEVTEVDKDGEITEELKKLVTKEEIQKYFDIRTDSMVEDSGAISFTGRKNPRGRTNSINLRGKY